ncbi:MAG: phosphoribosylformylglycinamidine synthase subunit PurL [Alphaproteobacteria bacterium]
MKHITDHLSKADVFVIAKNYGLSKSETEKLLMVQHKYHKRLPTITEIAVVGALWSEHCSYKSSKLHIKKLHFDEPWVITAAGENAGAIDIGDGEALIFKMESHNHPSYLEPFHGAATGVGGILRDIFTMGAKPIANLNALRFGDIDDKKLGRLMKRLVKGVVGGISHYGNCVGVPMVMGETEFLPCYNGNILVNAMTIGLVDKNSMASSVARGVGHWVIYLGSKTGRDGVKGAVMASQEFAEGDHTKQKPAVQVGDPFAEKLLMDLCLRLIREKKFIAIQDMGAAGLSSSSAEMADKGGVGIELELAKVPSREMNMHPEDIMLSESQERMLAIIDAKDFAAIKTLFTQSHLDCEKIGEVIQDKKLLINMHGRKVADLATGFLVKQAPIYDRRQKKLPAAIALPKNLYSGLQNKKIDVANNIKNYLIQYFLSGFGGDKSFIYHQYDRLVQGNSVLTSDEASAAVLKIPNRQKAIAMACHADPLLCHADPLLGGRAVILETYRKICAVGAMPMAYTNNLNFGNPEDGMMMAGFATLLTEMAKTSRALKFPTISGNVSFYNETAGQAIYHTPVIGGVGLMPDYKKAMGCVLPKAKQMLWLLGDGDKVDVAGSRYGFLQFGNKAYAPMRDIFSVASEKKIGHFVYSIIADGLANHIENGIKAVKAVGAAGVLIDVIKMALTHRLTLKLLDNFDQRFWFGIGGGRYIISADEAIASRARREKISVIKLGETEITPRPQLIIGKKTIISMDEIKKIRQTLKEKINI